MIEDALKVIRALREYVQAIPDEVAAKLPAMPGIDADWMDKVEADPAQAIPEQRPMYACAKCGFLYGQKVSSCDCLYLGEDETKVMEQHFKDWIALPIQEQTE